MINNNTILLEPENTNKICISNLILLKWDGNLLFEFSTGLIAMCMDLPGPARAVALHNFRGQYERNDALGVLITIACSRNWLTQVRNL